MSRKRSQSLEELRRDRKNGNQTDHRCNHMPSQEEIRAECLEIQAGWTETDERSHRVQQNPHPVLRQV